MDARGANTAERNFELNKSDRKLNYNLSLKIKPLIACVVNAAQRVNFSILKKDFKEVRRGEKIH